MIFPASMADMVRGGYIFLQTKDCPHCGEVLRMFRTPRGRVAPFVRTPRGRLVSHFAVCKAARTQKNEEASGAVQGELFPDFVPAKR